MIFLQRISVLSLCLSLVSCFYSTTTATAKDASTILADNGKTSYSIFVSKDAPANEKHAATELAEFLNKVSGCKFAIINDIKNTELVIAVGPDAAKSVYPGIDLSGLGNDGIIIKSEYSNLILTGGKGALRGTLYAVYTFLQDNLGCRWWMPSESHIPEQKNIKLQALNVRYVPKLEYRDPYYYHTFNKPDWAVRNRCNGHRSGLDDERGGKIEYCRIDGKYAHSHTFEILGDPKNNFAKHPEWFSEIDGKRVGPPNNTQLCLTNRELLNYCIEKVRRSLRENPGVPLISISQNDWDQRCRCAECSRINKKEKSDCGTLLRFVNAVADAIAVEFPDVSVDTLAYKYTRKAPALTRPRKNVVIRLCDIECSLAHSMNDPYNSSFSDDVKAWDNAGARIYIWDYVTNFHHYLLPFPNFHMLGPNLKFFASNGVKGVFEQGNNRTYAGEFAELRAWVLSRLLWNPDADAAALIREFCEGYYGPASPYILSYISALTTAGIESDFKLRCTGTYPEASYLTPELLQTGEELFDKAEKAVGTDKLLLTRIRRARTPVRYAILCRYGAFSIQQKLFGKSTLKLKPYSFYRDYVMQKYHENKVKKTGEMPEETVDNFEKITGMIAEAHTRESPMPEICKGLDDSDWFELQEDGLKLSRATDWCDISTDKEASNGIAVCIPGDKYRWSVQLILPEFVKDLKTANEKWIVFVSARVTGGAADKETAFKSGIYDDENKKELTEKKIRFSQVKSGKYQYIKLFQTPLNPDNYIWFSPPQKPGIAENVFIDRVIFVRKSARKQ